MQIDPDKARASFFKLHGRNPRLTAAIVVVQRELLEVTQSYMNWRKLDPKSVGALRALSAIYSLNRVKRAMVRA